MKCSILAILLLFPFILLSQPPDSLWSVTFGGSGDDAMYAVLEVSDGNFILGGYTESYGAGMADFWLMKVDGDGDTLWTRTFGGDEFDVCSEVRQTSDGGYILAGSTRSFGSGERNIWLVKTDSIGNREWDRTIPGSDDIWRTSLHLTPDAGYILSELSTSYATGQQFHVVKTDSLGYVEWDTTCNGIAVDAQPAQDNGYFLARYEDREGQWYLYLTKLDDQGHVLWENLVTQWGIARLTNFLQLSDGNFVFAGDSSGITYPGIIDFWLLKTDAYGTVLWSCTYGGEQPENCCDILQTADGGFVLAGYIVYEWWRGTDVLLVRTDAEGNTIWDCSFGGSNNEFEDCRAIQLTVDGEFVIAGSYCVGLDPIDALLMKLGPESHTVLSQPMPMPQKVTLYQNYPNPFNPTTTISYDVPVRALVMVNIYNVLGQHITTLLNQIANPGTYHLTWNGADSPSGIYFVQLTTSTHTQTIKTVLLK